MIIKVVHYEKNRLWIVICPCPADYGFRPLMKLWSIILSNNHCFERISVIQHLENYFHNYPSSNILKSGLFSRGFNLTDDKFSIFYADLNLRKGNFSKFCDDCTSRLVNLSLCCGIWFTFYSLITNLRFRNENLYILHCFVLLLSDQKNMENY